MTIPLGMVLLLTPKDYHDDYNFPSIVDDYYRHHHHCHHYYYCYYYDCCDYLELPATACHVRSTTANYMTNAATAMNATTAGTDSGRLTIQDYRYY